MAKIKSAVEVGIKSEYKFISILNEKGIPYKYLDDWYDFEVLGQKVDVKCCRISQKFSDKRRKVQAYKIGRFSFTDKQRDSDIYIAFFVRHEDQFLFMGFAKVSALKGRRYLSIHNLRSIRIMSLDSFIKRFQDGGRDKS